MEKTRKMHGHNMPHTRWQLCKHSQLEFIHWNTVHISIIIDGIVLSIHESRLFFSCIYSITITILYSTDARHYSKYLLTCVFSESVFNKLTFQCKSNSSTSREKNISESSQITPPTFQVLGQKISRRYWTFSQKWSKNLKKVESRQKLESWTWTMKVHDSWSLEVEGWRPA